VTNQTTSINPQWQQVIDYYNSMRSDSDRISFLKSLTDEQQQYLQKHIIVPEQFKLHAPATLVSPNTRTFFSESDKNQIIPIKKPTSTYVDRARVFSGGLFSSIRNKAKKAPFYSTRSSRRSGDLNIPIVVGACSVFGIISFIATGLIFNFNNTMFFIRQIPVFGDVLGVESVVTKDAYLKRFEDYVQKEGYSYQPYDDEDRDGITNIDEFIWDSNMTESDQNGNSIVDGQDLIAGIDHTNNESVDRLSTETLEKLALMDSSTTIHNRIFAYSWENQVSFLQQKDLNYDYSSDGAYTIMNTDDGQEYELDLSQPIYLTIEKLGLINSPLNIQSNGNTVLDSLNDSRINYLSGSPLPGQIGDSIITLPNNSESNPMLNSATEDLYSLGPNNQILVRAVTTSNQPITLSFDIIKNNLYDLDSVNYSNQLSSKNLVLTSSHPELSHEKRLFITSKLVSVSVSDSVEIPGRSL